MNNVAGVDVSKGKSMVSVSYTHLDVYKRQILQCRQIHLINSFTTGRKAPRLQTVIFRGVAAGYRTSLHIKSFEKGKSCIRPCNFPGKIYGG